MFFKFILIHRHYLTMCYNICNKLVNIWSVLTMIIEKIISLYFDEDKKYVNLLGESNMVEDENISLKREEKLVLYYLHRFGQCNMGDITNSFGFAHSTTNYIVISLQNKGLIDINKSPADNRVRIVTLTEKGKQVILILIDKLGVLLETLLSSIAQFLPEVFKNDLTEDEIKNLLSILDKISSKEKPVIEKN